MNADPVLMRTRKSSRAKRSVPSSTIGASMVCIGLSANRFTSP